MSRIPPRRFEALIAAHFTGEGYAIEPLDPPAGAHPERNDVDLRLVRAGNRVLVQCRRWSAYPVSHHAVQSLIATRTTERATTAILVTTGRFTAAAHTLASRDGRIRLIEGSELAHRLGSAALTAEASVHPPVARERSTRSGDGASSLAAILMAVAICGLGIGSWRPRARSDWNPQTATTGAVPYEATSSNIQPLPTVRPDRATPIGDREAPAHVATGRRAPVDIARHATVDRMASPDLETARVAVRGVPGVRRTFWVDAGVLMVIVGADAFRTATTIDAVCDVLAPLGGTVDVVVDVTDGGRVNGDADVEPALSGTCRSSDRRVAGLD